MGDTHPGVLDEIDFFGWSDRTEAQADGEELASYAALWQAFLDENGCDNARLVCPRVEETVGAMAPRPPVSLA
jgi:hypothetical protein